MFASWAEVLPGDFVVSVKASRYLTHVRRLHEPEEPVQRLMERARCLARSSGPCSCNCRRTFVPTSTLCPRRSTPSRAVRGVTSHGRVAVEFRHESWFDPAVRRLLADRGAACCLTDRAGRHGPSWRTADWGYVRFHEGRSQPSSCYGRSALATWARRLAELWPATADVFVYFNNDGPWLRAPRRAPLCSRSAPRGSVTDACPVRT